MASLPSWLDPASRGLVADLVSTLAARWPDLLAVVLYGSIARHDERPLDDTHPSDVDLLAIFSADDELITVHRGLAVSATLEPAYERHLDAPRDYRSCSPRVICASGTPPSPPTWLATAACSLHAAPCHPLSSMLQHLSRTPPES